MLDDVTTYHFMRQDFPTPESPIDTSLILTGSEGFIVLMSDSWVYPLRRYCSILGATFANNLPYRPEREHYRCLEPPAFGEAAAAPVRGEFQQDTTFIVDAPTLHPLRKNSDSRGCKLSRTSQAGSTAGEAVVSIGASSTQRTRRIQPIQDTSFPISEHIRLTQLQNEYVLDVPYDACFLTCMFACITKDWLPKRANQDSLQDS